MAKASIRKRADDPRYWDSEVASDIYHIQSIIETRILDQYQRDNYDAQTFALCAFTQLMICLNDMLAKAHYEGLRLNEPAGNGMDITDLISKIRNAACHIPSLNTRIGMSTVVFAMNTSPNGDISYAYGQFGIMYHTGVLPVFKRAKERLIPLTNYPSDFFE